MSKISTYLIHECRHADHDYDRLNKTDGVQYDLLEGIAKLEKGNGGILVDYNTGRRIEISHLKRKNEWLKRNFHYNLSKLKAK